LGASLAGARTRKIGSNYRNLARRLPNGLIQPWNPGVATLGRCPIPSPRESGERARERGRRTFSRGRAFLPPRFARRPLNPAGGEANSPDARKLSIPPTIQTVRCSRQLPADLRGHHRKDLHPWSGPRRARPCGPVAKGETHRRDPALSGSTRTLWHPLIATISDARYDGTHGRPSSHCSVSPGPRRGTR